jgi:hypothetical protein
MPPLGDSSLETSERDDQRMYDETQNNRNEDKDNRPTVYDNELEVTTDELRWIDEETKRRTQNDTWETPKSKHHSKHNVYDLNQRPRDDIKIMDDNTITKTNMEDNSIQDKTPSTVKVSSYSSITNNTSSITK